MKDSLFVKFDPENSGIRFIRYRLGRFSDKDFSRRIHEILQQIGVRADVKTVEFTEKYQSLFGKEKQKYLATEFQIFFDSETTDFQKEKVYAAMVGFNFGYWERGI